MTNPANSSGPDAMSIHRRAIIVDMHADTTQRLVDENADLNQGLRDGHLDAVRAQEGGLDAQFFSIWVEPELLAEIEYRAKSAEGKVRHPYFKGIREDL